MLDPVCVGRGIWRGDWCCILRHAISSYVSGSRIFRVILGIYARWLSETKAFLCEIVEAGNSFFIVHKCIALRLMGR